MKATEICAKAAELVGGDRDRTHGNKLKNHQNIADLWNAYLGVRLGLDSPTEALSPLDVALMMALLKIARTMSGSHNPDDYVDLAGYGGCAGEIAAALHETETPPEERMVPRYTPMTEKPRPGALFSYQAVGATPGNTGHHP
jgi:hypothetical protein